MSKNVFFIVVGVVALLFAVLLLRSCAGCGGRANVPDIAVATDTTYIEKGDSVFQEPTVENWVDNNTLEMWAKDIDSLLTSNQLYRERYQHYKNETARLIEEKAWLEMEVDRLMVMLDTVPDCDGKLAAARELITNLKAKAANADERIGDMLAQQSELMKMRHYTFDSTHADYRIESEMDVAGFLPSGGYRYRVTYLSPEITSSAVQTVRRWPSSTIGLLLAGQTDGNGGWRQVYGAEYIRHFRWFGAGLYTAYLPAYKDAPAALQPGVKLHFSF